MTRYLTILLAIFIAFITWVLISLGAIVRLYGAGLACPDWPLCYGTLLPEINFSILLEVSHRYLAALLGLLFILLYALSWKKELRIHKKLAGWLLFLVIFQGIFGGLTVLLKLNFLTVVVHLLLGNLLFLGIVYFLSEVIFFHKALICKLSVSKNKFYRLIQTMIILLFVMLLSGGLNSSNYAGYACNAFPFCNSDSSFSFFWDSETTSLVFNGWLGFFLSSNTLELIHLAHRVVVILISLLFCYFIVKYWLPSKKWKCLGSSLLIILFLEIVVGIINALFKVPISISALHTALASILVGLLAVSLSFAKYPIKQFNFKIFFLLC